MLTKTFNGKTLELVERFSIKKDALKLKAFLKSTFTYESYGLKCEVRITTRPENFLFRYEVFTNWLWVNNNFTKPIIEEFLKTLENQDETFDKNCVQLDEQIDKLKDREYNEDMSCYY